MVLISPMRPASAVGRPRVLRVARGGRPDQRHVNGQSSVRWARPRPTIHPDHRPGWKSGKASLRRFREPKSRRALADSHSAKFRQRPEEAVQAERQAEEVGRPQTRDLARASYTAEGTLAVGESLFT